MHSDDMEEIDEAGAGEVVAMFRVDCRLIIPWDMLWLIINLSKIDTRSYSA